MKIKSLYYCLAFCLPVILNGCIYYVPQRHAIEDNENYFITKDNQLNSNKQCRYNDNQTALDGTSIKLIAWNYLAGCRHSLKNLALMANCSTGQADNAFMELTRDQDLILLQEAYLDHEATQLLKQLGENYSWNMGVSFISDSKRDIPTGVLTIANAESLETCLQRAFEPAFPTPKSILFTRYNVKNKDTIKQLLVVNIHAVLMGTQNYIDQLEQMATKIDSHDGPVILAGDFNTLTSESHNILMQIINELNLTEAKIVPEDDHRVRSISRHYYDFIFYKKLQLLKTYSIDLKQTKNGKTSDHNPVFAEFRLAPNHNTTVNDNQE